MPTEESRPYDPLDTKNLGESLVRALEAMDPIPIAEIQEFPGAGVYALYYTGNFEAYEKISNANANSKFEQAIYVGKAIPSGGRKGAIALGSVTGKYLHKRLAEHRKSIEAAENLSVTDFYARWIVVEPIWIPLTETLMINRSACAWNQILDGFGNHDPGRNRHAGQRTRWDIVHPGREWALKGTNGKNWTSQQLQQEVKSWIAQRVG